MKKALCILLSVCLLSVPALAVEWSDFEYITEDGFKAVDTYAYNAAVAAEKVAAAGLSLDVDSYWITDWLGNTFFDNAAFEADYTAAIEEQEEQEELATQEPAIQETVTQEPAAEEPAESESVSYGTTDTTVSNQPSDDTTSDSKYPVGSYVDEAGNVFSPEGELLSPGTTPAADPGVGDTLPDTVPDVQDPGEDSGVDALPAVYTVSETIADDPLLLIGVVVSFVGLGVGLFKRLLHV